MTEALTAYLNNWLEHDVDNPQEINQGYCADFAHGFTVHFYGDDFRNAPADGFELKVCGLYDLEDLQEQHFIDAPKPAWISWNEIKALTKQDVFNHSFIKAGNWHFDCECLARVPCPFDLPIFKRAVKEYKTTLMERGCQTHVFNTRNHEKPFLNTEKPKNETPERSGRNSKMSI